MNTGNGISYELAKRLKDAGFPQIDHGAKDYIGGEDDGMVSIPTLEELIAECEDKIDTIFHHGLSWKVGRYNGYEGDWINGEPSESEDLIVAIAELYIKENKK